MSQTLDLRDPQALTDLQSALARFDNGTQEGLRAAEAEIGRTLEWLHERIGYWQRETERARREMERAEAELRRCEASGYRDEQGYYHAPDCSSYIRALARAQAHLREFEENLRTAQAWRSRIEQAANEYRREARRLSDVAGEHTEKARAQLGQLREKYDAVQAAATSVSAAGGVLADGMLGLASELAQSALTTETPRGITWAEKQAILKKIDAGQTISREEFEKFILPISDLRAETLQADYSWVNQVIQGERFYEATKGLRSGEIPTADPISIGWSLLGVAADTLKVLQFWDDK